MEHRFFDQRLNNMNEPQKLVSLNERMSGYQRFKEKQDKHIRYQEESSQQAYKYQ